MTARCYTAAVPALAAKQAGGWPDAGTITRSA
jgi:hypothetical protein